MVHRKRRIVNDSLAGADSAFAVTLHRTARLPSAAVFAYTPAVAFL
jgi:hypothetical protein